MASVVTERGFDSYNNWLKYCGLLVSCVGRYCLIVEWDVIGGLLGRVLPFSHRRHFVTALRQEL